MIDKMVDSRLACVREVMDAKCGGLLIAREVRELHEAMAIVN